MLITIAVLLFIVCVLTLIPIFNWEHWSVRLLDYPCKQLLLTSTLLLIAFYALNEQINTLFYFVCASGFVAESFLIYKVYPYTKFAKVQLKNAVSNQPDLRILIANVFMENENYALLIDLLKEKDADFVMLVETDHKWENGLKEMDEIYPYRFHKPLSNTYGMMIYSKLEMESVEYKYIVKDSIPSFHARLQLRNGKQLKFYGLHPEPPFPTVSKTTKYRDAEILTVGKEIKASNSPVIVAGDLNDVAWSYTTKLFQKESNLLDPRKGRGFFSTFHAKYFWARWPLDHIFVSKHFSLVKIERLRDIGSDHFPIYAELKFSECANNSETQSPNSEDRRVIEDKVDQVDTKN